MVMDRWLSNQVETISPEMIDKAFDELEGTEKEIEDLADRRDYWDSYARLTACISFFNAAGQQQPSKQPGIIGRLLNWIQKIKSVVDKIVKGVGGSGYSIGVSAPFGVSVSISFSP